MIKHKRIALGFHGDHVRYADGWEDRLSAIDIKADTDWDKLVLDKLASGSMTVNCFRHTLTNSEVIYFKRYVLNRRKPQFTFPMPSKAIVENFGFNVLAELGIPTLEVLAMGERRHYGRLVAAFIVTRGVEPSADLEKFAAGQWYDMPEPQRSQTYLKISESLLAQLKIAHTHNFCHHDLKWRNILVQRTDNGYNTVWIDCPRAKFMRLRKKRRILIDIGSLARLAMSYLPVREQLRWLQRYARETQCRYTAKELFRGVQGYLKNRPPPLLPVEKKPVSRKTLPQGKY